MSAKDLGRQRIHPTPITIRDSFRGVNVPGVEDGLTKREDFARAAMQAILSRTGEFGHQIVAVSAVKAADALLKELAKESK